MAHYPINLVGKLELTQRQHIVLNAAVFQLAWLACVIGGSLVAIAVTLAVVALHLKTVPARKREFMFLTRCAVIGFICDLALIQAGVMNSGGNLPPLWLTSLWVLFGTTVGYALRFFHGRLVLGIIGGGVFAPLSYFGGARLADVSLLEPVWAALLIIGLLWAVIFPLLIHLYTASTLKSAY